MLPEDPQSRNEPTPSSPGADDRAHGTSSAIEGPEEAESAGAAPPRPSESADDQPEPEAEKEEQFSSNTADAGGRASDEASSLYLTPPEQGDQENAGTANSDPIRPAEDGANPDDPSTFLDLLANGDFATQAATQELLAAIAAEPMFTGFEHDVGVQPAPAFYLAVNGLDLLRVIHLLETSTPKSQKLGPIRFSVSAKDLTIQAFPDAFFQLRVEPNFVYGLSEDDKAVLFIRGEDLRTTCAAFEDEVELRHIPVLNILHVASGNFERPIVLEQPSTFTPLNEKFVGKIDPDTRQALPKVLAQGIKYVSPHVAPNPLQPWLSVIDCNQGVVVGGTHSAIARFRAPVLHAVDFCFDQRYAALVSLLLDGVAEPSLYTTDYFYVLNTAHLSIGIPKSSARSKIINLRIEPDRTRKVVLARSALADSITRVEHALGHTTIRIRTKEAGQSKAELTAAANDGAWIRESIHVLSTFEKVDLRVASDSLKQAIEKEWSANVVLHLSPMNALILDDTDGQIEAVTAIAQIMSKADQNSLSLEDKNESAAAAEA